MVTILPLQLTNLKKLESIYNSISQTVTEISKWRCPYKNAKNFCTANFGCRNQLKDKSQDKILICTGSDDLAYRNAWEI